MNPDEALQNSFDEVQTLEEAYSLAARHGIHITKPMLRQMAEIEQAIVEPKSLKQESFLDWVNRRTPKILQSIEGASAVLFTMTRAIIVSFGVPVVLFLFLIVEQQRVAHGIALFETNEALASFAGWALVILNLTVEFMIEYTESQHRYQSTKHSQFSLRILGGQLAYFFGLTKHWQPLPLSPAHRYKRLLRMVTFTILILALAGSMRTVITQSDAVWYRAIEDIVLRSDLNEMITWASGLLFAGAGVLAAQGLSRYIAVRCVEIIVNMNEVATAPSEVDAMREKAVVQFILATISEKVEKKKAIPQLRREGD
jgi:hypothetical protein